MRRTSFDGMECPIARGLDQIGEWWSILILREAFHGFTRFDQFQRSLGIAPNMLTRRLTGLVESGLLEKRLYNERPPRHEYVLTAKGRDFWPVLVALTEWGNRHFAPEGHASILVDAATGKPAQVAYVDAATGRALAEPDFKFAAGPAASEGLKRKMQKGDEARLSETRP